MENKRREWVKTAAIIFLTIMLLLTFFSNTIMNYSLPEVSAKYVQSGSLSEQIRGAFLKMESISKDKSLIFSKIVEWIKNKTQSNSVEACEAIVSFFVQNCEVFYEITE